MKKMIFLVLIAVPIFGSAPVQSNSQVEEQKREIVKLMTVNKVLIKDATEKIKLFDQLLSSGSLVYKTGIAVMGFGAVGCIVGLCHRSFGLAAFSLFAVLLGRGGCNLSMSLESVVIDTRERLTDIREVAMQSLERQNAYIKNPNQQMDYDTVTGMEHIDTYSNLEQSVLREMPRCFQSKAVISYFKPW
jgi:hypothetical protein